MEINSYDVSLFVAFWIVSFFFVKELIANPREDQYLRSIGKFKEAYFVEPEFLAFLYKDIKKYENYIGVWKDRYVLCSILFPLWCLVGVLLLLGFLIGPEIGMLCLLVWWILLILLSIVYVLPCELKLYKKR